MRGLIPMLFLAACAGVPVTAGKAGAAPKRAEPEPPAVAHGRFVTLDATWHPGFAERAATVYVPPGAEDAGPLPVLYVVDGQLAFSLFAVDGALDALLAEGRVRPWLVVAVPSGPRRDRELSRDADAMTDFVLDAIAPVVAARFDVSSARADTAVLGYSFGGLFALRAHLRRPDRVGCVIAMSPSLWYRGRDATQAFASSDRPVPSRLWIDVGTAEDARAGLPYMVAHARELRDAAVARGMRFGDDVGYAEIEGETHSMNAAGRRMREALAFALGEPSLGDARPVALSVFRYPVPRGARRGPFAVQADYEGGVRLTWPAEAVELRRGQSALSDAFVEPRDAITASLAGLSVTSAPD